jgi:hypothetical protein
MIARAIRKLEIKVITVTAGGCGLRPAVASPLTFGLSKDDLEQQIVGAYIQPLIRAATGRGARAVSVARSGLLEVQTIEMRPDILSHGVPPCMLGVLLPLTSSSADSYGLFDLDDATLIGAVESALGLLRRLRVSFVWRCVSAHSLVPMTPVRPSRSAQINQPSHKG